MKICIIDDEKDNRDILTYIISQHHKEMQIVGEADSVKSGLDIINQLKPDLIFLDIEMPDGTGFDLIKQLKDIKPEIIFCTAYNQFALKAIECSALAYVLKPIIKSSIAEALEKATHKVDANYKLLQYEVLNEQLNTNNIQHARILLSCTDKLHVIYIRELIACLAHSNYTEIILENNKKITVAKTLKEMENVLQSYPQFFRIHHSHLINTNLITAFIRQDNNIIVKLTNGMQFAVSRSKKEELMEKVSRNGR